MRGSAIARRGSLGSPARRAAAAAPRAAGSGRGTARVLVLVRAARAARGGTRRMRVGSALACTALLRSRRAWPGTTREAWCPRTEATKAMVATVEATAVAGGTHRTRACSDRARIACRRLPRRRVACWRTTLAPCRRRKPRRRAAEATVPVETEHVLRAVVAVAMAVEREAEAAVEVDAPVVGPRLADCSTARATESSSARSGIG